MAFVYKPVEINGETVNIARVFKNDKVSVGITEDQQKYMVYVIETGKIHEFRATEPMFDFLEDKGYSDNTIAVFKDDKSGRDLVVLERKKGGYKVIYSIFDRPARSFKIFKEGKEDDMADFIIKRVKLDLSDPHVCKELEKIGVEVMERV